MLSLRDRPQVRKIPLCVVGFLCLCLLCLSSCKDELDAAFDKKAFDRNKKRWEQLSIKDYTYYYSVSCRCGIPRPPGDIVVRGGKIQETIPLHSYYEEIDIEQYMTIDGFFKLIEHYANDITENFDMSGFKIHVEYDAKYFYPKSFAWYGPNLFITVIRFEKE